MTLAGAANKLNKAGFKTIGEGCNRFKATRDGSRVIEFHVSGTSGHVDLIRVRRETDRDDSMTDYCAGHFASNITRAIKSAAL